MVGLFLTVGVSLSDYFFSDQKNPMAASRWSVKGTTINVDGGFGA
ncbi:MAG: hypothetical protein WAQ98_14180 [Blastocatellia bacterium]